MKVHIVFAHPNINSFNGQLRKIAIDTFTQSNSEVSVSDLFQINFKASADEKDFTKLHKPDYFDLQAEQLMALQNGTFTEDIQREHRLLTQADLIIFQFPFWWYSMPAVLKGYIERVFSYGYAYGRAGKYLQNKQILISTSTGSPLAVFAANNRSVEDYLKHLIVGTFELCGLKVVEPFIVHGAKQLNEEQSEQAFNNYKQKLISLQ